MEIVYAVLVQSTTNVYKDICVSQKTWLPLVDEVWAPIRQGYQRPIGPKLGGSVWITAPKVCEKFENNWPLGGNIQFGKGIHVCTLDVFHTYTQYSYHMIELLMLDNFASRTTADNQICVKWLRRLIIFVN